MTKRFTASLALVLLVCGPVQLRSSAADSKLAVAPNPLTSRGSIDRRSIWRLRPTNNGC